ncbi:MAG TPA: phosphate ABC transporter substrate-binding protein PstS, partial [Methylophilaceae bacterium]|nr:phosphate ABC transporter substrate-binding protein PstS [Methylophilaceae bacterium]
MQVSKFNFKAALLVAGLTVATSAFAIDITGAGATFPYP